MTPGRGTGPITVLNQGQPVLLDFTFNGWGNKYPADKDALINQGLKAQKLFNDVSMHGVDFVLEGGSIDWRRRRVAWLRRNQSFPRRYGVLSGSMPRLLRTLPSSKGFCIPDVGPDPHGRSLRIGAIFGSRHRRVVWDHEKMLR